MSPDVWAIADRAVRELAPQALDALLCREEAARLRALDPIVNSFTAGEAVSAALVIRGQQSPRADSWEIADLAGWVAYAAERGRAELVTRRAEALEYAAKVIVRSREVVGEVSHGT